MTIEFPIHRDRGGYYLLGADLKIVDENDINALGTKLEELRTEITRLNEGWAECNDELFGARLKHVGEKDDLQREINAQRAESDTLRAEKNALRTEIWARNKDYEQLIKENEELNTKLKDTETSNWTWQALAVDRGEKLEANEKYNRELLAELKKAHRATWDTQTSLDNVVGMHKVAIEQREAAVTAHYEANLRSNAQIDELRKQIVRDTDHWLNRLAALTAERDAALKKIHAWGVAGHDNATLLGHHNEMRSALQTCFTLANQIMETVEEATE